MHGICTRYTPHACLHFSTLSISKVKHQVKKPAVTLSHRGQELALESLSG